ncbi:mucin-1-like [Brachypodium distachyon]|uniref:mucin-1-like n=1 Tax=Brachypodium distachyon TaxID=15368 RepID=UPI00071D14E2|nr:mucin-1-like [Brachypodium distachyon]|eukprot:XP_014751136.1 mucin-1-like [Brachypodium distachyon]
MGPSTPRKGKEAKPSKGKSAAAAKAAEEKELKKQEMRATLAFFRPGYNGEAVGKLQHTVASDFNDHGKTLIFPAGAVVQSTDFRVFGHFILTGLIKAFRLAGLADLDVARVFITRRIAPLQRRSLLACAYTGAGDRTRLREEGMDKESLQVCVRGISGEDAPYAKLPPGVFALNAGVPRLEQHHWLLPTLQRVGADGRFPHSVPALPSARTPREAGAGGERERVGGRPAHDSSSDDETGRVAAAREVIPMDEEEDDVGAPLIVRRSRARAAVAATSTAAAAATAPAVATGSMTGTTSTASDGTPTATSPAAVAGAAAATTLAATASDPVTTTPAAVAGAATADTPAVAPGDTPPTTDPLATLARTEEEGEAPPTSPVAPQGPSVPAPEAGVTVTDLDSDVVITGTAKEPEAAPATSPAAPAATAAATTVATGTAPGDVPAAADAAGADSSATQQEAAPAVGMEEEQQDASPQANDPPPSQTVAAGASSSSAATVREHHKIAKSQLGEVRLAAEEERQELSWLREKTRLAREEVRLAREALEEATTPVVLEEELYRRLEAQRAELQETLDSLKAAQAKAEEEHRKALAMAQARLDEKSDLITSYAGQIQGLRVKLEV